MCGRIRLLETLGTLSSVQTFGSYGAADIEHLIGATVEDQEMEQWRGLGHSACGDGNCDTASHVYVGHYTGIHVGRRTTELMGLRPGSHWPKCSSCWQKIHVPSPTQGPSQPTESEAVIGKSSLLVTTMDYSTIGYKHCGGRWVRQICRIQQES